MTERARPEIPTWNILATSIEGQREALLAALRRLARFRRGGFPNVLVATVEDPRAFLEALAGARAGSPLVQASLGKVIPIERTLRLDEPARFVEVVGDALVASIDRLVGRTFFVRVFRRGFRGAIDSTSVEGELGGRLVGALQARGEQPKVTFADADVAVVVETLRDEIGIAFLGRELRVSYPFVRVR